MHLDTRPPAQHPREPKSAGDDGGQDHFRLHRAGPYDYRERGHDVTLAIDDPCRDRVGALGQLFADQGWGRTAALGQCPAQSTGRPARTGAWPGSPGQACRTRGRIRPPGRWLPMTCRARRRPRRRPGRSRRAARRGRRGSARYFTAVPADHAAGAACAMTKASAAWPNVGAGNAWLTGPPSLPQEMRTGQGCRAGWHSRPAARPGFAQSCCRRESGISCGNYGCFKPGVAVRVSRAGTTCALRDYVWFGVARASAGSWVAAQLARNRRASSSGEPASALKATRARPGSAGSSITS